MGGTHFLQTGYLLLNRNAPYPGNPGADWEAQRVDQRREKRHFSVIQFTPEGNHKRDNSVSEKSQVGKTIYPRLSGKTQHCE